METVEIILALNIGISGALAGLYWGLFKVHGCQKRTEAKLDAHFDMEYLKEEITDVKDAVRVLKDG